MKASVYKRKSDGRWVGAIDLPRDRGEKRRRKTFYGDTEREVREKVNIVLYELQVGEYVAPSNDRLVDFLKKYHNICSGYDAWDSSPVRPVKAKWAETTSRLYKMYIDVHFEPYFKDMRIVDIKPSVLDAFYNFKMTSTRKYKTRHGDKTVTKTAQPLGVNTTIKLHKFLSASFNYAVSNDLIKKNPATGVMLDSPVKYKPNVYSEKEFLELLDHVHGNDEEIPIILGAGCGLRRAEICGLKWQDVDLENKTVTVRETITNFISDIEKSPKNETSSRQISAPQYVIDVLSLYYEKKERPSPDQRIITRWKPKSLSERFKFLLEKFNMPPTRLHDLRHYNAVVMLNSGIPDKVAAERLGHANVSTLREVYQHVIKDMDEMTASKINDAIKPKKDKELTREERKAMFKII